MTIIDITILIVYIFAMLGVGVYFMEKNNSLDDYYVGGRNMGSWHIGLSVVATDVGGGFSIGLGGLGFAMGLAGSWMLFTGLIGAWISAVYLIPKVKKMERIKPFYTMPEMFEHFYNKKVAILAAIISIIGYVGFTSSQLLAGAKLASVSFDAISIDNALIMMGVLAVVYTTIGGIKAVIYTDTIQWIILMGGLFLIGIPISFYKLGGFAGLTDALPTEFFDLSNIQFATLINWMITIIPIWFVGMTLYQRIYACPDEKTAKKAWFIAGFLEYPLMAFMGVLLGLFARAAMIKGMFLGFSEANLSTFDPELGLPLLIKNLFPIGLLGLILAAYLSAVLSTADSCLMAASGSFVSDLYKKHISKNKKINELLFSKWVTLSIGILAILLALKMQSVLSLMLSSYSFMVSGLFIPVLMALFSKKPSANAAFFAMIIGGTSTLIIQFTKTPLPLALDANFYGIILSFITYQIIYRYKH